MRERQLRRRCRALLNELKIRPPLDVAELCRRVAEQRGKPIRLVPHPIPALGPFGAWISAAQADYILYQQETSMSHKAHIVLHELGHILIGHSSAEQGDALLGGLYPATESDALQERYPDFDPYVIRRALGRTYYDTEQEREAETVATIILEWASVLDYVVPQSSADTTAQRMSTSLSDRLGWL
jgi:hypothetical protein